METTDPLSWTEYIRYVKSAFDNLRDVRAKAGILDHYSDFVFRGHANHEWTLETSLERFLVNEQFPVGHIRTRKFYYILDSIVPAINSLSGKSFERIKISSLDLDNKFASLPCSELLSYARHHGFPTPLLDWSRSFYVAAFFAYSKADPEKNSAVYMFQEWTGGARGGWLGEPIISGIGHYINTDQRHFRQQSEYTYCSAIIEDDMVFCNHEKAAIDSPEEHKITKIILDHRYRREALADLSTMNINDYTLYGDNDALMRSLAFEKFVQSSLWSGW